MLQYIVLKLNSKDGRKVKGDKKQLGTEVQKKTKKEMDRKDVY